MGQYKSNFELKNMQQKCRKSSLYIRFCAKTIVKIPENCQYKHDLSSKICNSAHSNQVYYFEFWYDRVR